MSQSEEDLQLVLCFSIFLLLFTRECCEEEEKIAEDEEGEGLVEDASPHSRAEENDDGGEVSKHAQ